MLPLIVLLSCSPLLVSIASGDLIQEWQQWRKEHGRIYANTREENERFSVFADNLARIEEHNRSGTASWQMGLNQFSDLTPAEFEAQYLGGYKRIPHYPQSEMNTTIEIETKSLPDSVDWREHGVVGDVQNQGSCGSCWAFAATQQVESYAALASGHIQSLSTQQVG